MSRMRATLSPTETDREIQLALDRAAREIEAALRVASSAPLDRHRKRDTLGDLQQALDQVTRVRYLSPPRREQESYEDWKDRQDKRDQQRKERRALREQADVG